MPFAALTLPNRSSFVYTSRRLSYIVPRGSNHSILWHFNSLQWPSHLYLN